MPGAHISIFYYYSAIHTNVEGSELYRMDAENDFRCVNCLLLT